MALIRYNPEQPIEHRSFIDLHNLIGKIYTETGLEPDDRRSCPVSHDTGNGRFFVEQRKDPKLSTVLNLGFIAAGMKHSYSIKLVEDPYGKGGLCLPAGVQNFFNHPEEGKDIVLADSQVLNFATILQYRRKRFPFEAETLESVKAAFLPIDRVG